MVFQRGVRQSRARTAGLCEANESGSMRLKSGIWVAAYLRRCQIEGASAVLRRRGSEEAGAIFIKVSRLDGSAAIYGPAPQWEFDESHPRERAFSPALKGLPLPEADVEAYLARQI